MVWTTGGQASPGIFYVDIWYATSGVPWRPYPGDSIEDYFSLGPLIHEYYAGTKSCTSGGISVGSWTMGHWHDATEHTKNP
ncbi:MAG: hypothetical protein IH851_11255 [Armatimonadetes bacterium]|nr:hypothetical protein [Armatimonadota bacterium]